MEGKNEKKLRTLADFYREAIMPLSKDELKIIKTTFVRIKPFMERTLFGWDVYYDNRKEPLHFTDKDEAEYVLWLLEAGVTYIVIPKDKQKFLYAKDILNKIRTRIIRILDRELQHVINPKKKEEICGDVWNKLARMMYKLMYEHLQDEELSFVLNFQD